MPRSPLIVGLILYLGLVFAGPEAIYAQEAPAPSVEELYLARDDGKGKAGEQVTEFATTDVPIYCIVLLDNPQKVTVKMNFVAVDVAGMKKDTKVVTASYTTKEGQNRVNFSGRPEGKWPPGRYRVDIFLDGKAAKVLEFDIKGQIVDAADNNTAAKFVEPVPKPKPIKRKP